MSPHTFGAMENGVASKSRENNECGCSTQTRMPITMKTLTGKHGAHDVESNQSE